MEIQEPLFLAVAWKGDHSHQEFRGQSTLGPYCNPGHMETLRVTDLAWVFSIPSYARGKQSLGFLDIVG